MRLAAVALAWLAVGCASPERLVVGYHGSDEGFAAAQIAAGAWNDGCGRELVEVRRGDGDVDAFEVLGTVGGQAWGETLSRRSILGICGPRRAYAIRFMAGSYAPAVLAHEFGHALGLGHVEAGIMRPGGQLEALDPATGFRTIAPGMIGARECEGVMRWA